MTHPDEVRRRLLISPSWRELSLVVLGFGLLSVLMTFPLAMHLGTIGRADNGDGQFSIWNVAWVARTLVVDPAHVLDANIFYPRRGTLTYSETNLGAGFLAIPVYWTTRNPHAAHNFVLLLSFVFSATGMYYLVRYLTGDRRAAVVAAICFAFCPYVFAHTPHIQLLMTAGLPFSMLAFHRFADDTTADRAVSLGCVLGAQVFFCGYYAVFAACMVGIAGVMTAVTRRRWADRRYWVGLALGAAVALGIALPLLVPYLGLARDAGFGRAMDDVRRYSADWRAYFASASDAHAWLRGLIGHWKEVLFPGVLATTLGISSLVASLVAGGRSREIAIVYGAVAAFAFWASLGPDAGLYGFLYSYVPVFTLMRAPSRLGVVVDCALAVLTGVVLARMFARIPARSRLGPTLLAAAVAAFAVAEHRVSLFFPQVPPVDPVYRVLASLPRGALLEMPVFSNHLAFARTRYMLSSTAHWMPLVNAYSDHIPPDFLEEADVLGGFPSREAFKILERDGVRYAVFHLDLFGRHTRHDMLARLREFDPYLVLLYADERTRLYEIVGFPP